jgi:hypothetical protein
VSALKCRRPLGAGVADRSTVAVMDLRSWGADQPSVPGLGQADRSGATGQPSVGARSGWGQSAWTRVFVVVLAVAHLVDEIRFGSTSSLLSWVVVAAAGTVLVRPRARFPLAVLTAAKITHVVAAYPVVNNHDFLYFGIDMVVVGALAVSYRSRDDLLATAWTRRTVRGVLLVGYGAAAVAKWNRDFFSPEFGCAAELIRRSAAVVPAAADWLGRLADPVWVVVAVSVAAIETLVVVLLAVPAWRRAGIVVAVVFHTAMAASPTAIGLAFFASLLASLVAFLSDDQARRAIEVPGRVTAAIGGARMTWYGTANARLATAAVCMTGAGVFLALFVTAQQHLGDRGWWLVMFPMVAAVAVVVVDATLAAPWSAPEDQASVPVTLRRLSVGVLGLMMVVASQPYLGAGTVPAFTMYSNLRTEQSTSNHFVIPSFAVLGTQQRLVTTDPDALTAITWHEAARLNRGNGGGITVYDTESSSSVAMGPSQTGFAQRVAYKLVRHRDVDLPDPVRCRW